MVIEYGLLEKSLFIDTYRRFSSYKAPFSSGISQPATFDCTSLYPYIYINTYVHFKSTLNHIKSHQIPWNTYLLTVKPPFPMGCWATPEGNPISWSPSRRSTSTTRQLSLQRHRHHGHRPHASAPCGHTWHWWFQEDNDVFISTITLSLSILYIHTIYRFTHTYTHTRTHAQHMQIDR